MFQELSADHFAFASPRHRRVARRSPGILIADDLALVLALLRVELESRGFETWLAGDGEEALGLYRENREAIDLVLLDVEMPLRDGPEALAAIRGIDPFVLACFMTGGTTRYTEEDLLDRGAACLIRKPFQVAPVGDMLARLVGGLSYASAQVSCGEMWSRPARPR